MTFRTHTHTHLIDINGYAIIQHERDLFGVSQGLRFVSEFAPKMTQQNKQ